MFQERKILLGAEEVIRSLWLKRSKSPLSPCPIYLTRIQAALSYARCVGTSQRFRRTPKVGKIPLKHRTPPVLKKLIVARLTYEPVWHGPVDSAFFTTLGITLSE